MLVKADDVGGGELGVVGDDGPGITSFLADDDTADGFGGKIGIEVEGFDFGNPHSVVESLSSWGTGVDGLDEIFVLLLVVFEHGEEADAFPLQKLEIVARPEAAIKAEVGESEAALMDGLDRGNQGIDISVLHGGEADIEEGFGGDVNEQEQLKAEVRDPPHLQPGGFFKGGVGSFFQDRAIQVGLSADRE